VKVCTPAGRALYARRQGIAEPVLGQSKAGRGFRRFLRRWLATIRGAGRLGCLTHNLLKLESSIVSRGEKRGTLCEGTIVFWGEEAHQMGRYPICPEAS
jgi:hypothetical protein